MSKDGQDDKNVNNDQVQLNDKTNSNIQEQQENTSINNDTLTPEAVTSPSNANIAGAQNTVHITNVSNEVQKPEVTTNDHVENEEKSVNNEQGQSQLDINIGGNQNKAAQSNQEDKEVKSELDKLLSRIDKGEPPQKLEDAQVRNVLGAIKAQLTATANPAELARLASAAASLASSTNNPEILEQIKGIQAVIAKKEETAEQIISSDIAADNLEVQEPIEHTEHKANIAKYADIKADFHKKLDEDLELLDAAIDPSRATPEQRRILEDDLTDAEREELKRKAQLKKEGYEHVYNIKEHAEKEIEQNNTKITEIDERLKTTKDNNQIQSLEAEQQQYIRTNEERQKELDAHVKNELAKRDKERKKLAEFIKLKERVEKYPTTAQRFVREHFELHAAEYDKNPDLTAINELHAMVRKVGLAKELGVAPEPQEIEPISNINEKQEVIKQDLNKAINQVHEQYSGPVPREATDKIANIILHNEGYPHHREIMKIENMDKTKEQKLIKSINPPIILGQLNPSNTPNKPTKGQDRKI